MSATNRGAVRRPSDYYPTPKYTTRSLIQELTTEGFPSLTFGEPCVGTWDIPSAIPEIDHTQWKWAELEQGRDYLTDGIPDGPVDAIITNPPFGLFVEFLDTALGTAPFVAFLLRLNVLGSQKRHDWWQDKLPSHLYALSKRPSFTGKGTDATEYAWFVWDELGLCNRPPGVYVI